RLCERGIDSQFASAEERFCPFRNGGAKELKVPDWQGHARPRVFASAAFSVGNEGGHAGVSGPWFEVSTPCPACSIIHDGSRDPLLCPGVAGCIIGPNRRRPRFRAKFFDGRSIVTEQEIEAKVIEIVAEQMAVEKGKISRETRFIEDLNAD